jgi:hypothetical protein
MDIYIYLKTTVVSIFVDVPLISYLFHRTQPTKALHTNDNHICDQGRLADLSIYSASCSGERALRIELIAKPRLRSMGKS